MKVFFRNIHLYLGLAAGLVIMTCCFTGAVLVFEKELQEIFHKDRYFVEQQSARLPIEQLISNVKQQYPKAKIASVKIYPEPTRSVEIGVSMPSKDDNGKQHEKGKGIEGNKAGAPGVKESSASNAKANST